MSTYAPQPQHPQEPEPKPTPWSMIIGIVLAVVFVFIGIPILACVGIFGYGYFKAREVATQIQHEIAAEQAANQQPREDLTLSAGLADALYPTAKEKILEHWEGPSGVRGRKWSDWQVRKIADSRYEIFGNMETVSSQTGEEKHKWSVEFTPLGTPSPEGEWEMQRIVVDGQQCYP